MDKEKQDKLSVIRAERPPAEEALAEAKSALEAHEEADVELTFLERAFGGKSADEKIAAYDKRTAELSGEVKRCEAVIADLDRRERDPFEGKRAERRKQLEAIGQDDYDKSYPDDVREREMLEELYEKHRIGHVSNPISQPSGHKRDIESVARIMEIEARRGLTEAETVAKHEGVRKVLEVIEKYRSGESDRGDRDLGR